MNLKLADNARDRIPLCPKRRAFNRCNLPVKGSDFTGDRSNGLIDSVNGDFKRSELCAHHVRIFVCVNQYTVGIDVHSCLLKNVVVRVYVLCYQVEVVVVLLKACSVLLEQFFRIPSSTAAAARTALCVNIVQERDHGIFFVTEPDLHIIRCVENIVPRDACYVLVYGCVVINKRKPEQLSERERVKAFARDRTQFLAADIHRCPWFFMLAQILRCGGVRFRKRVIRSGSHRALNHSVCGNSVGIHVCPDGCRLTALIRGRNLIIHTGAKLCIVINDPCRPHIPSQPSFGTYGCAFCYNADRPRRSREIKRHHAIRLLLKDRKHRIQHPVILRFNCNLS